MPKGYIIGEVHLTNPGEAFAEYREKVQATLDPFGGRFLARGGEVSLLEGEAPAGRPVIIEFESPEQAMQWYNSPAYQAILPLRLRNATTRVTCAAGV